MADNPTTALVKNAQSPALARVSSQLALTDKLLTKPEEPFLIPYRKGKKWGFCDRNKNIVIGCIYNEVGQFNDGLAVVKKNEKFGYINKDENVVVALNYDAAMPFKEKFAAVANNTKWGYQWGYINSKGEVTISQRFKKWEIAKQFNEGKVAVQNEGSYGYMNVYGELIVPIFTSMLMNL